MPLPVKVIFLLAPVVAVVLFIFHWFSIPIFGKVMAGTVYYYLLYAILGFNIFMGLGASRKLNRQAPPWYDYILAFILWGVIVFFLFNADEIAYRNWDSPPNNWVFASALVIGALAIEASRRVGGWALAILLLFSIIYPLFASNPFLTHNFGGVFYGVSFPFKEIISSFAFGEDGMLGVPARMLGELVLGFFLFAGLVMGMGGGEFFMKLANSILGRVRGGQAKVAILVSGFFGSITGSPIANIAGTGAFTIPAMKQAGFQPEYAAAVEATASTGSDTMPPVLGGLVFLMVIFFGVDYADVVVAAFIPSILFFLGLLVQVDGYAARKKLRGQVRGTTGVWWRVLAEGWVYIVALGILVFGLVYMRWGAITPLYAVAAVLVLQLIQWALIRGLRRKNGANTSPISSDLKRTWKHVETGLVQTSGLINYTVAVFLGMGFILVGLLKTGMAAGLANWIVSSGGDNLYAVLAVCAVFCIVMGMVGLQRTAYIFLAVIAVPAVIAISKLAPEFQAAGGLSVIGLNLFLIFYSSLGGITPPVAIHSFIAANIAGAHPMRTAWLSYRLGAVLIFLPFFFILQPSLLIINSVWWQIMIHFAAAATGIWLLSSGLAAYLIGIGSLNRWQRILLIFGGFSLAFPQPVVFGLGLFLSIATIAVSVNQNRQKSRVVSDTVNGHIELLEDV
ncbi:hypothetical protein DGWBC_1299 [Dehalogenimonas sp. WBC-2]|nr:hypothetical protein DGWBC_1299 [Dehalogenimonas sp. WBC-2]